MNAIWPADEVIDKLVRWGSERDDVRAMVLTSSRAIPGAASDIFSDYDVILIVRDVQPYYESRQWLEAFGRVLVLYRDPLLPERGFLRTCFVTQFESGLKIDFSVWPVELLQTVAAQPQLPVEFEAGYRVLLDKDGMSRNLKPPRYMGYIPKPPNEAEYRTTVELFFHEATYAAKHLWRGDLMAAKYNLDAAMKMDDLRQMLEWHVEIDHDWKVKPGPYGRRLQKWLRPDLWSELEATYVGPGFDENWDAMFRTISLFRKVAVEVGDCLGFAYPQDLHERAVAYLERVQRLPRPGS